MTDAVADSAGPVRAARDRSRLLRRFMARSMTVAAAVVLAVILAGALFAPWIAPQDPYNLATLDPSASLLPPAWDERGRLPYVLGTDVHGRDILSTILYGSRTSFVVGFCVVLLAGLTGATVGVLTGYVGGLVDHAFMRLADSLLSFSATLIALLFLGLFKASSVLLVILAITIVDWVPYARTMRGSVLAVKEEDYVQAARAVGAGHWRIVTRHILPNALAPLLVIAAVNFAVVVMLEATLSFLGVGVPITEPSLGMMISQGKDFIYAGTPHLILPPAIVLMAIVFSLNLIGDWLRDEFDPRVLKL